MGSVIFVIIIVVVSIATSVMKQKQDKARKQAQNTTYQEGSYSQNTYTEGKPSYNKSSSYNRSGSSSSSMRSRANSANTANSGNTYATIKAAERAKENMTAQELKSRPTAQEFKKMAGVDVSDGAILSAAKMHNLATELGNEYDSQVDLMTPVFDLMVTGPDTSIPNERDFVSEGMDMINSYTLES